MRNNSKIGNIGGGFISSTISSTMIGCKCNDMEEKFIFVFEYKTNI
jgi:hypothetical protein